MIFSKFGNLLNGPGTECLFRALLCDHRAARVHIIIGMTVLLVALVYTAKDKITADRFALLENAGLYWHLVDLIWIFIFPLFYLII